KTIAESARRLPSQFRSDKAVVGVSAPYTQRSGDMRNYQVFPRNLHRDFRQPIDTDHLFRPDIHRTAKVRLHQPPHALDALVYNEKRTSLLAAPPDLAGSPFRTLGHFPADRRGGLFPTAIPGSLGAEDVVEPCNVHFHAVVTRIGKIEPLAEQFLPAVFAVRS